MLSGRRIILTAWSSLPEDVLAGPLSHARNRSLLRRAALPLLRGLTRGTPYTAAQAYSTVPLFEGTEIDILTAIIVDAAATLSRLTEFFVDVRDDVRARGAEVDADRLYTAIIVRFFEELREAEPALGRAKHELCDVLAPPSTNGADDTELTVSVLRAAFDDPATVELLEEWMSAAYENPPEASSEIEQAEYRRELRVYLDSVGFAAKRPVVDPSGAAAWSEAVRMDAPDGDAAGLSQSRTPRRAPLERASRTGDGRPLPLDRSVFERLWSTARSGSGRSWRYELPGLRELIEREIAGLTLPYGLAEPEARAGLAAAVQAYSATQPTSFLLSTADYRHVADGIPVAARFTTAMIRGMLLSIRSSPTEGWAALSPRAQDELLSIETVALAPLWDALHNAQYRPSHLGPAVVWGMIAGEVNSLLNAIKTRHRSGREGDAPRIPVDPPSRAGSEADSARDERVKATFSLFDEIRGVGALPSFFSGLHAALGDADPRALRRIIVEWEATADECGSGATWDDLRGYLDDNLGL